VNCSVAGSSPGLPWNAGESLVTATVLRLGKTMAFGEIRITTGDGVLAAHATTSYALL